MSVSKKDHIALPAQTLRRFREPAEKDFFYLDVKSGIIDCKGPNAYQKQKGYYQENYDAEVRKLENVLGKVTDIVTAIAENDEQDAQYDREWLKDFIIALIALQIHRRPELKDAGMDAGRLSNLIINIEAFMFQSGIINNEVINRANKYRQMLVSERAKRNFFYERTDMRLPRIVEKLGLHELGATFVKVPKSFQTTFLLTPYHFIQAGKSWIFTITPRLAIALLPIERFNEDSRECGIWEVNQEGDLDLLIPSCIRMTKQSAPPHLIGERYTLAKARALL